MRQRLEVTTLILALALTVGCPQTYRVRLKPASTASTLTLLLDGDHPKPVDMVKVATCGRVDNGLAYAEGQPVWLAYGWELPDPTRRYREVSYGQHLIGFSEEMPPSRLSKGCYTATVVADGATGTLHLWVDSLDRVRLWTAEDYDSASAQYNQYATISNARADSAITLCLAAYRASPTAQDSALTDQRVMVDSVDSKPFTCRDYRRLYWSRFQKRPWSEDSTGSGA
jgi:hypothetical protein